MKQLESVSKLLEKPDGTFFVQEFYRDDQTDKVYKKFVEFETLQQYWLYLRAKGITR